MKQVRENLKVIQKDGRGRSLSFVTRSDYRVSNENFSEMNTVFAKSDDMKIVFSSNDDAGDTETNNKIRIIQEKMRRGTLDNKNSFLT